MKWIRNFAISLVLMALVGACLKQPEYSVIPQITLNDLYFKPGNIPKNISDTLVLKFDFKDGDGNLGIGAQDSTSSDFFNPWYYLYDINTYKIYYTPDRITPLPDGYKWVNYTASKNPQVITAMQADNIFSGSNFPDINCTNWEQESGNTGVTDTLFITQNTKAYNITVDFFVKVNGNYIPYDPGFQFPGCQPNLFWGTFKDLSSDRGKKSPVEGTFRYNITSAALNYSFSGKTLKIQVTILDRAFHQSNIIEKKDFTLAQITK